MIFLKVPKSHFVRIFVPHPITKGNFNLEYTIKTFKHETNLRFHIKIGERFYEYAMKKLGELCHAFDNLSGPEFSGHACLDFLTLRERPKAKQTSMLNYNLPKFS